MPGDEYLRFSTKQVDRIINHLDSSSLAPDVCQSDTSDNIQSTPGEQAEFLAPDPSNESARGTAVLQREQIMPQIGLQRTRQPPNILSYYSLGQPVSFQARISDVNLPEYPRQVFSYVTMNIQTQRRQYLDYAHGLSVYNAFSPVHVPIGQYMSTAYSGPILVAFDL